MNPSFSIVDQPWCSSRERVACRLHMTAAESHRGTLHGRIPGTSGHSPGTTRPMITNRFNAHNDRKPFLPASTTAPTISMTLNLKLVRTANAVWVYSPSGVQIPEPPQLRGPLPFLGEGLSCFPGCALMSGFRAQSGHTRKDHVFRARRGMIATVASAAAWASSGTTLVYVSAVNEYRACPSVSCTTFISTSAANMIVAAQCRRS